MVKYENWPRCTERADGIGNHTAKNAASLLQSPRKLQSPTNCVPYSTKGMTSGIGSIGMTNMPTTVSAPRSSGTPTTA